MRTRLRERLQKAASSLMLVAALAFLCQAVTTTAARAAVSMGSAPHPALVVSGALHLHGHLAKLVHFHGGDTTPGHVHHPHHGDSDDANKSQFWGLGCASAVMPTMAIVAASFDLGTAVRGLQRDNLDGVEPDGLQRPPSTPGIA
jgi:hypothetical protein